MKTIRTPTLNLVGDRDGACPAPPSFEFWHATQALSVQNGFAAYPYEGHSIFDPDPLRDIMWHTLECHYLRLKQSHSRGEGPGPAGGAACSRPKFPVDGRAIDL